MDSEEKYIGFLRYSGESVKEGLLDLRKSGEALLGFDEALHYFLSEEDKALSGIEFEIPVRIRKGSWEALIPVLQQLFSPEGALLASGGVYLSISAKKAAEDGFFETGAAKDIRKTFKAAIISMQWVIRIASHVGNLTKGGFNAKILSNSGDNSHIEIANHKNEKIIVLKKYLDKFTKCPSRIFSKNARIIDEERIMEIGVYNGLQEDTVTITVQQKEIFYSSDEDTEILFPELKHGQYVELEGVITRGNEKTNTIGFEYRGHVLTGKPEKGSIVDYKSKIVSQRDEHIFPKGKIIGMVDREDENGEFKDKRPRVIFSDIILLDDEKPPSLFDK